MQAEKWLSVIGIGEDGLAGLSAVAQSLLQQANLIVGGKRHLAMLDSEVIKPDCEKLTWGKPIETTIQQITQHRGRQVCVLASGDPLCYGIGTTLLRQIPLNEVTILPALSAFSLACARLGWSLPDVETLSLCGRDPALLNGLLYPGAKLLVLSANRQTPAIVAQQLNRCGYGDSQITVLERMGGSQERSSTRLASEWSADLSDQMADLNTIAITCPDTAFAHPRQAGLPDAAYRHDGQLTKREVRAITLSTLAPLPGQLLWDVGAGCGSIGIEWLRSHRHCRAIAIEQHPTRLQYIAENAASLGVPDLKIIEGTAPNALRDLPQPDAIFIGGGLTTPNLLPTCWQALPVGGRLVANAVTVETEQKLLEWHSQYGGELIRMAIQRTEPIGRFWGWKMLAPITQWSGMKK